MFKILRYVAFLVVIYVVFIASSYGYIHHVVRNAVGAGPHSYYLYAANGPWFSIKCSNSLYDIRPDIVLLNAVLNKTGPRGSAKEIKFHFGAYRTNSDGQSNGDVYSWSFWDWQLAKVDSSNGGVELRDLSALGCENSRFKQ